MILQSLAVGFVEGVTEFLPVSSSIHLWLLSKFTGSSYNAILVQLGAIFAAFVLYSRQIYWLLRGLVVGEHLAVVTCGKFCLAFLPIVPCGMLLGQSEVFWPLASLMLFLGGVLMIIASEFAARDNTNNIHCHTSEAIDSRPLSCDVTWRQAFIIGVAQCFALIPGVSRSGITIAAALFSQVKRQVSVEFSFLLALPTIGAAVFFSLFNGNVVISKEAMLSFLCSFIVGLFVIKPSLKLISTRFGIFVISCYRILLSVFVIIVGVSL